MTEKSIHIAIKTLQFQLFELECPLGAFITILD